MYQDAYAECNVKRETPAVFKILTYVMIALCVITLIAGLVVFPLLIAFLILLAMTYYFMLNSNLEYEYLYVSGEIDFDVIKWQRSRKRILEVNMDAVTVIAPEENDVLKGYMGRNLKAIDYSSGTDAKKYVIVYKDSGKNDEVLIYFEPDGEFIDILKSAAPNKVHVNDYN